MCFIIEHPTDKAECFDSKGTLNAAGDITILSACISLFLYLCDCVSASETIPMCFPSFVQQ